MLWVVAKRSVKLGSRVGHGQGKGCEDQRWKKMSQERYCIESLAGKYTTGNTTGNTTVLLREILQESVLFTYHRKRRGKEAEEKDVIGREKYLKVI